MPIEVELHDWRFASGALGLDPGGTLRSAGPVEEDDRSYRPACVSLGAGQVRLRHFSVEAASIWRMMGESVVTRLRDSR